MTEDELRGLIEGETITVVRTQMNRDTQWIKVLAVTPNRRLKDITEDVARIIGWKTSQKGGVTTMKANRFMAQPGITERIESLLNGVLWGNGTWVRVDYA